MYHSLDDATILTKENEERFHIQPECPDGEEGETNDQDPCNTRKTQSKD